MPSQAYSVPSCIVDEYDIEGFVDTMDFFSSNLDLHCL